MSIDTYINNYGKMDKVIDEGNDNLYVPDITYTKKIFEQVKNFDDLLKVGNALVSGKMVASIWHFAPIYGFDEKSLAYMKQLHMEKRILTIEGQGGLCIHKKLDNEDIYEEEKPYVDIAIENFRWPDLQQSLDKIHKSGIPLYYTTGSRKQFITNVPDSSISVNVTRGRISGKKWKMYTNIKPDRGSIHNGDINKLLKKGTQMNNIDNIIGVTIWIDEYCRKDLIELIVKNYNLSNIKNNISLKKTSTKTSPTKKSSSPTKKSSSPTKKSSSSDSLGLKKATYVATYTPDLNFFKLLFHLFRPESIIGIELPRFVLNHVPDCKINESKKTWKPVMSLCDALNYTKGTKLEYYAYHATSYYNAQIITRTGFKPNALFTKENIYQTIQVGERHLDESNKNDEYVILLCVFDVKKKLLTHNEADEIRPKNMKPEKSYEIMTKKLIKNHVQAVADYTSHDDLIVDPKCIVIFGYIIAKVHTEKEYKLYLY